MPNFSQTFPVGEELLDFRFSLIHRPGDARYWVSVCREGQYMTSFYLELDSRGTWKISDRFKTVPGWVHAMESLLVAAITSHKNTGHSREV